MAPCHPHQICDRQIHHGSILQGIHRVKRERLFWGDKIGLYLPEAGEGLISNRFSKNATIPDMESVDVLASVVETPEGALEVKMTGGSFHTRDDPEAQTFIEVFQSWGAFWVWDGHT